MRSGKRRTGISTLELALGASMLVLVAVFIFLFVGSRHNEPHPRSSTNALETETKRVGDASALDMSLEGNAFKATDGGGGVAVLRTDYDAQAEESWPGEMESMEQAPAYRGSNQPLTVSGDDLREYFGGAFAITGRPNWQTFLTLARKLDSAQIPAAWSLLREQPWSKEKQETMKTLVEYWARKDPKAAIDFALTLESSHERNLVYGTAVESWAATDPKTALAWYEAQQLDGGSGRVPIARFLAGLYASDSQTALDLVWKMDDPRRQSSLLRSLFLPPDGDKEIGASKLRALFDVSENDEQRKLLGGMLADVWGADDPMRAIAWAAELKKEPDVQQNVYMSAAQAWGKREPEAAMVWLESQELAQVSPHVLQDIARNWERDNVASLERWIASTAPSTTRDAVVAVRIESLRNRNPGAAFALAETMTDSNDRNRLMTSVADRWMQSDMNAAAVAVLASDMPPEMKRKYALRVIAKNKKK